MNISVFGLRLAPALLLGLPLLLLACGSDDGDTDTGGAGGATSAAGSANAGGTSSTSAGTSSMSAGSANTQACGIGNCNAGQYCNNGICVNGCLTDANCGSGQLCADIDGETKVGTCMNQSQPVEKDCNAFCDKALACQDPEWVSCMQVCTGLSSACVACVNDSNCGAGCDQVCEI